MGQRLITNVYLGGERIFACYKHWSAYSCSSLQDALAFADSWARRDDGPSESDLPWKTKALLAALRAWEGSGLYKESRDPAILAERGFAGLPEGAGIREEGLDRSLGLIQVTPDGMAGLEVWEEGRVDIYIGEDGTLTFYWDVYWLEDEPEDEDRSRFQPRTDEEFAKILDKLGDNEDLTEDELRLVLKRCEEVWDSRDFGILLDDGRLFTLIA